MWDIGFGFYLWNTNSTADVDSQFRQLYGLHWSSHTISCTSLYQYLASFSKNHTFDPDKKCPNQSDLPRDTK